MPSKPLLRANRSILLLFLIVIAFGAWIAVKRPVSTLELGGAQENRAGTQDKKDDTPLVILAASGRVEGRSDTINLGAGTDGVISRILVTEGEHVKEGQVMALIFCDDLRATVAAAEASITSRTQERVRLLRGSREEERRDAAAQTELALARANQSETQYRRMKSLFESGIVSKEIFDNAVTDFELSRATYRSAVEKEKLINASPLPEDVARLDAEIRSAQEGAQVAKEKMEKCLIKAPSRGTILRIYRQAGESVSTVFPQPVMALVDDSNLRIRAEVDERDIALLHQGQKAVVQIDAFPGEVFEGRVTSISSLMGRKRVLSGNSADKADRDVLDTLVDLDKKDDRLVVGLRVTIRFLAK